MNTIDPDRVHSLVETHLDNLIADIQKELAVETGEAPARFFPGLKREGRSLPSSAPICSATPTSRVAMRGTLARCH